MAGLEYEYIEQENDGIKDLKKHINTLGALGCFCSYQDKNGAPADQEY